MKRATGIPRPEEGIVTTVLVDDDPADRQILRALLAEFDFIRIVGEAESVTSAVQMIGERNPALILLDVNLPVRSGFELLPHVGPRQQVVVVTELDSFAVRAFEFDVADFLLKPIRRERLATAISRVRRAVRSQSDSNVVEEEERYAGELVVGSGGAMRVVPLDEICFIKAIGNYSQVHVRGGRRLLVRRTMEAWSVMLPKDYFCRPHRSLIMNLALVRSVARRSRDEAEVVLCGCETPVTVGRRASLLLHRILQQLGASTSGYSLETWAGSA